MRILRRKIWHINLERLSEYLDGRLSAREREKVERHLEACHRCREEMESLEYTVGLLRQTPSVTPRRAFTLEGAPAPSTAPVRWGARAPTWAYGAAVSMAVLLFALVLSADLSGLLAQDVSSAVDQSGQAVEAPLESTPPLQPTVAPEMEGEVEVARPKEPQHEEDDGALPDSSKERAVAAPTSAPQVSAPGTEAPAAAAPAPPAAAPITEAEAAAAPAPPAAAPITEPEAPAAAAPLAPPSPEQAEAEDDVAVEATPTPLQQATPLPTAHRDELEQVATPGPSVATSDIPESASSKAEDGATAVVWRVLEGVFGGVALLLVGGVLWRMRRLWRRTVS